MKLYLIEPVTAAYSNVDDAEARHQPCHELIAELIIKHIGDDPGLFGLRHINEVSEAPVQTDTRFGDVEASKIRDSDMLRTILLANGNPYNGKFMLVRSLVSCRAVSYGADGQAWVCLPTDADPIVTPDESLVLVEERSDLLIKTDWMDGLDV